MLFYIYPTGIVPATTTIQIYAESCFRRHKSSFCNKNPKMAARKAFVCKCAFERNFFIKQLEKHFTFQSDAQFSHDYKDVSCCLITGVFCCKHNLVLLMRCVVDVRYSTTRQIQLNNIYLSLLYKYNY